MAQAGANAESEADRMTTQDISGAEAQIAAAARKPNNKRPAAGRALAARRGNRNGQKVRSARVDRRAKKIKKRRRQA